MAEKIAILLLTSGAPAGQAAMIARATKCACSTGVTVHVVIAADTLELAGAIAQEPVTIVPVPKDRSDISGELRTGIRSLPKGLDGVLVMLADSGLLTGSDLEILLTHFAELGASRIICATDETGHPGYPLILPARHFGRASKLGPEHTPLNLLQQQNVSVVRLQNGHAHTGQNLPESWVAWRAASRPTTSS